MLLLAVLSWGQPALELFTFLSLYFYLFLPGGSCGQGLSRAPGHMPPKVLSLPTLSFPPDSYPQGLRTSPGQAGPCQ